MLRLSLKTTGERVLAPSGLCGRLAASQICDSVNQRQQEALRGCNRKGNPAIARLGIFAYTFVKVSLRNKKAVCGKQNYSRPTGQSDIVRMQHLIRIRLP